MSSRDEAKTAEGAGGTGLAAKPHLWGITPDLDGLSKLAIAAGVLAYGTGTVAINTYLHELGITDFSFAKPKLLMTGVLVLSTLLLLASPPFFLAWRWASLHSGSGRAVPRAREIAIWGTVFLLGLMVATSALCFKWGAKFGQVEVRQDPGLGQITVWEMWERLKPAQSPAKALAVTVIVAAAVYLPILAAAVFVYLATRIYDRARSAGNRTPRFVEDFYFAAAIVLAALYLIGYVYMFTRTFYPAIPQEFGGGQPYYQSFAIADAERCHLRQIGIPFEAGAPRMGNAAQLESITMPLPVLHESDTLVAVWLKCPRNNACNQDQSDVEEARFVVVQIEKSEIGSMQAYRRGVPVPALDPTPCVSAPGADAAQAGR